MDTFWARKGCVVTQPDDRRRVGRGPSIHYKTTLKALGPEPWKVAYVQPSRRPTDGRYGENRNRLQHYYQYQVILKVLTIGRTAAIPAEHEGSGYRSAGT